MRGYHAIRTAGCLCVTINIMGCVASNPVYHVTDEIPANLRGASFYLPQTRLALGFVEQTLSYVEGRHTVVVERCDATVDKTPIELCTRFELLGIASLRPSTKDGDTSCGTGAKQKRVGFKSFTLTSSAIPDPSQAYIVDLGRNWFQDFNFSMELDAYGVVGKAQAKTVEKAADDALAFGLGLAARAAGVPQTSRAASIARARADGFTVPQRAALADLKTLEDRIASRSALVAAVDEATLSRSAVAIAQLNAEIAQLTNAFTGKRTVEESEPQSVAFIPRATSKGAAIPVHTFDHCGGDRTADTLQIRLSSATDNVLPEQRTEESRGADASDPPFDLAKLNGKDAGWPHRVPVHTIAKVAICTPECKPFKPLGEVGIAQYGTVYRLPSRTGGKSSNVAAAYSALGSLTKIDVDQEEQAATPIFTTLSAAIAESQEAAAPKEADLLAAEIALIKSRQELCRLIYGVDDERCLGANPPVE